jgi:hypothetical protein
MIKNVLDSGFEIVKNVCYLYVISYCHRIIKCLINYRYIVYVDI